MKRAGAIAPARFLLIFTDNYGVFCRLRPLPYLYTSNTLQAILRPFLL